MPASSQKKPIKKATANTGEQATTPKPVAKKKTFDAKFSATRRNTTTMSGNRDEKTIMQAALMGEHGTESKCAVCFWAVREDGPKMSCWGDKVLADLVFGANPNIIDHCHVERKVFKLFNADGLVMKGNKAYDRRCYVILFDEPAEDEVVREILTDVAEEVNKFPTIKESQKIVVPQDFIVERNVPFVAKLGNEQTVALCESVFAPLGELQDFHAKHPEKFANFWKKGTMTAKIAAFFGLGSEWIMASQQHLA